MRRTAPTSPALSDAQFNWLRDIFEGKQLRPYGQEEKTMAFLQRHRLVVYLDPECDLPAIWCLTQRGAAVLGQEAARRGLEVVALRKRGGK